VESVRVPGCVFNNPAEITMRYSLIGLLICILSSVGDSTPTSAPATAGEKNAGAGPLKLTQEEQKVVAVAQEHLKKTKTNWQTPIEVKRPPNRVNVPDWKKFVEEEKNIWKVVYETPKEEFKALGARTLFVNMRTNEVTPSARK
jgi:hypothetical protein